MNFFSLLRLWFFCVFLSDQAFAAAGSYRPPTPHRTSSVKKVKLCRSSSDSLSASCSYASSPDVGNESDSAIMVDVVEQLKKEWERVPIDKSVQIFRKTGVGHSAERSFVEVFEVFAADVKKRISQRLSDIHLNGSCALIRTEKKDTKIIKIKESRSCQNKIVSLLEAIRESFDKEIKKDSDSLHYFFSEAERILNKQYGDENFVKGIMMLNFLFQSIINVWLINDEQISPDVAAVVTQRIMAVGNKTFYSVSKEKSKLTEIKRLTSIRRSNSNRSSQEYSAFMNDQRLQKEIKEELNKLYELLSKRETSHAINSRAEAHFQRIASGDHLALTLD